MSNFSLHLIGNPGGIRKAYPDDAFAETLADIPTKSATVFTVCRKGAVNYYTLLSRLNPQSYIGLSIGVNGLLFQQPRTLMEILHRTLTELLNAGRVIRFNATGTPGYAISSFGECRHDYEILRDDIATAIHNLPAAKSGAWIGDDAGITAPVDATDEHIAKLSQSYHTVIVPMHSGVDDTPTGRTIKALSNKVSALEKDKAALSSEIKTLNRQKKQFKWIIVLMSIILLAGLGTYFLFSDLQNTREILAETKHDLTETTRQLSVTTDSLRHTQRQLDVTSDQLATSRQRLSQARSTVSRLRNDSTATATLIETTERNQPFIVTGSSVNWNNGQLNFNYYGLRSGYANVTMRVYGNGHEYSTSRNIYIYSGSNSASMSIGRKLDSGKYYSFELLINNRIIGGGRH